MSAPTLAQHSFSIYDSQMYLIGSSLNENLFELISGMAPLLVDSNAEWKRCSLNHPDRAFLLGRTIDNEAHNLEGVLFNDRVREGRPNVFIVVLECSSSGRRSLVIHRLDVHHKAIFKGNIPTLDSYSPADKAGWNDPNLRLDLRNQILAILESTPRDQLKIQTSDLAARSFKNYSLSCEAASHAYALMLLETGHCDGTETQKFLTNDENLFGDTVLVQEALFLGASILSNDQHVRRLASSCNVRCERQIP